jgi:valyl-tRNA synthetase
VTAFDIIFFWVARMMMMGLHFMKKVPFRVVYLTSLVVDENGEKMSKMKGNVIDPLDVVFGATKEELLTKAKEANLPEAAQKNIAKTFPEGIPASGADALRFTLAALAAQGRNIRLSIPRVEGYRHFANKLWNASRFALMNLDGFDADRFADNLRDGPQGAQLSLPDRWILSRLQKVTKEVDEALEAFKLNEAAQALYRFIWSEVCDWYIELAKPSLYDDAAEGDAAVSNRRRLTQGTLAHVLETACRMLHPFMPFITEEIWQQLPKAGGSPGSLVITLYPICDDRFFDDDAERTMGLVQDVAVAIRNIRAEYNVPPSQWVKVSLRATGDTRDVIEAVKAIIARAARSELTMVDELPVAKHVAKAALPSGVDLVVPLEGLIDVAAEKTRLGRDLAKARKEMESLEKKLGNKSFIEKAPAEVVEEQRTRLAEEQHRATRLEAAIQALE